MPENNVFPATALFDASKKAQETFSNSKVGSYSNWEPLGPFDTPIILSNGKKRGNLTAKPNMNEKELMELIIKDDKINKSYKVTNSFI